MQVSVFKFVDWLVSFLVIAQQTPLAAIPPAIIGHPAILNIG